MSQAEALHFRGWFSKNQKKTTDKDWTFFSENIKPVSHNKEEI